MLRLIAVLLLTVLATIIFVAALRTGRVQASFVESNVRLRADDPPSFWFFTIAWGLLSTFGIAGSSVLLYHGLNGTGPFASGTFMAVSLKDWPLALLSICCLFMIIGKARASVSKSRGCGA